jgi:hypothetical protein
VRGTLTADLEQQLRYENVEYVHKQLAESTWVSPKIFSAEDCR